MSRTRSVVVRTFVTLALTGCVSQAPPVPWSQPVALGPLNSEPWVSTQAPAGYYGSSGRNLPFQTPNSLPPGAWNRPGY